MPSVTQTEPVMKPSHTLHIEQRGRTVVTGVMDVNSFLDNEIVLKIDTGEMVLTGDKLHIAKLLLEEGQLLIDGRIDGVSYIRQGAQEGKRGGLKRLLRP